MLGHVIRINGLWNIREQNNDSKIKRKQQDANERHVWTTGNGYAKMKCVPHATNNVTLAIAIVHVPKEFMFHPRFS